MEQNKKRKRKWSLQNYSHNGKISILKWLLGRNKWRKLCFTQMTEALDIPTFSPQQTGLYNSELLMVAEAEWTILLSNCWPERGWSTIKRIKTRMRSRLTGDMLNALMHVSINGPSFGTEECTNIVQGAAEIWLSAKNRPKLHSQKENKVFIIDTTL